MSREEQWREMESRSFHPSQWFDDDGMEEVREISGGMTSGGPLDQPRSKLMWVYRESEKGVWTVGYFNPTGVWFAESDHEEKEKAAKRTHYLNGGN